MIYLHSIVIALCLAASLTISSSTSLDESETIHIKPSPRSYSMQIREFHECVSCHENSQARKNYDACLQKLSEKNRNIIKSCCKFTFGNEFCDKGAAGNIDYTTICQNPKKALEVGRCFWKKTDHKDSDDIQQYRECKREILANYCTTSSE